MPRPKSESPHVGNVADVYEYLHQRALREIEGLKAGADVVEILFNDGIGRPLDVMLQPYQERADACARREPLNVGRWELTRWFDDLPDGVWSFTLNPDGSGIAHGHAPSP